MTPSFAPAGPVAQGSVWTDSGHRLLKLVEVLGVREDRAGGLDPALDRSPPLGDRIGQGGRAIEERSWELGGMRPEIECVVIAQQPVPHLLAAAKQDQIAVDRVPAPQAHAEIIEPVRHHGDLEGDAASLPAIGLQRVEPQPLLAESTRQKRAGRDGDTMAAHRRFLAEIDGVDRRGLRDRHRTCAGHQSREDKGTDRGHWLNSSDHFVRSGFWIGSSNAVPPLQGTVVPSWMETLHARRTRADGCRDNSTLPLVRSTCAKTFERESSRTCSSLRT